MKINKHNISFQDITTKSFHMLHKNRIFFIHLTIICLLGIFSCNESGQNYAEEAVTACDETAASIEYSPPSIGDQSISPITMSPSAESYNKAPENPFKSTISSPLSTFSADVDRASYSNIRRLITTKTPIPPDAVRIEEMLNYFDYQYSQPKDNLPLAIHSEYSDCPWNQNHKLLKIGLQGKKIIQDNLPASNLVFLLDVSGSMDEPNKLPLLKSSFELLVNQLTEKDRVSIVVYAGSSGVVLDPTSGDKKLKIKDAIQNLEAGGGTAGEEGLKLAYKLAKKNFIHNGNNRIILATDGDFNLGLSSDEEMEKLIEAQRKSGVFLTCLGFGNDNYKDSKMEILANKGNGNYAYIDNISEANKFLGKELGSTLYTIAKDVKIQVEFNPNLVHSYRLIGYENRRLTDEDFKDDKKDAGELGNGHQVTALYEIIPIGVKSDFAKDMSPLKYAKKMDENTTELATLKIRYKEPQGKNSKEIIARLKNESSDYEKSSSDFKFASSVAMFGLMLSESPYTEKIKPNKVLKYIAKSSLQNDSYKKEFKELVELYSDNH
jgi:Ca-activated chloride channel family protein